MQRSFATALQHHQAGRFSQAEMLYRTILMGTPDHADSLHLLGVLAGQRGNHQAAIDLIGRAISVNGRKAAPEFHNNIALSFFALGQIDPAIDHFTKALSLRPGDAQGHYNLGALLQQKSRWGEAEASFRRAVALDPNHVEAHGNLGSVLKEQGKPSEAAAPAARAVALRPNDPKAHYNLAGILRELGRLTEAEASYRRAVALNPNLADAYNNLGNVLKEQGRLADALECYERTLLLKPDWPATHTNLANMLVALDRLDEALNHHEQALRLQPGNAEVTNNLSDLMRERGELDAAIGHALEAQRLDPDYAEAHWQEGLLRLQRGEFAAGWQKYEWRWRRRLAPPQRFSQPPWNGEDIAGRTILITAEQGRGDTIQFIRYAPLVKQRGARVVFECQPGLERLLAHADGLDQVVTAGGTLPHFDCHVSLLGLPRIFGTVAETIPAGVPYLRPEPALVDTWRGRISDHSCLNVGLVWRGSATHLNDRRRSIAAERFARICDGTKVNWHVLLPDPRPEEIEILSQGATVHDYPNMLGDWAETAALISQLDLVVAVDTGVAHLAGALGKPVWTMIAFAPDWRWLTGRQDSPWYPTMRLFRQPRSGDWDSVLADVRQALDGRTKDAAG